MFGEGGGNGTVGDKDSCVDALVEGAMAPGALDSFDLLFTMTVCTVTGSISLHRPFDDPSQAVVIPPFSFHSASKTFWSPPMGEVVPTHRGAIQHSYSLGLSPSFRRLLPCARGVSITPFASAMLIWRW